MAASTAVFASSGSALQAPVRDASGFSSSSAFGTSVVQLAPVKPAAIQSKRLISTRAGLSEEQKTAGKKVLASFVAAGAALSIAGQAFAGNPIDFAKSKADEVVSGAQDAASNLPSLPNIELPKGGGGEDVKNAADSFVNETKSRIDGIFGKNKPYPQNRVASTNGGTGNAIGDAKKRISNFGGKNKIADNVGKAAEDTKNTIARASTGNTGSARAGKELVGQDSTRVDEATRKAKNVGANLKNKARGAVNEAKSFVSSAQDGTPNIPVPKAPELPSLPSLPSLPNPLDNLKESAQDLPGKVGEVKDNVASNLPSGSDKPNLPAPWRTLAKLTPPAPPSALQNMKGTTTASGTASDLKGKVADVKGNVASKANGLKGNISKKPI